MGVHGLEPGAGVDLAAIKRCFGAELALLGNVDVRLLCADDADAVRSGLARSLRQGMPGGGILLPTCNSIFTGMNLPIVKAFFAACTLSRLATLRLLHPITRRIFAYAYFQADRLLRFLEQENIVSIGFREMTATDHGFRHG